LILQGCFRVIAWHKNCFYNQINNTGTLKRIKHEKFEYCLGLHNTDNDRNVFCNPKKVVMFFDFCSYEYVLDFLRYQHGSMGTGNGILRIFFHQYLWRMEVVEKCIAER